ncbi:MAG: hypothetical protein ACM3RR_00080 [Bacillota bacterium]
MIWRTNDATGGPGIREALFAREITFRKGVPGKSARRAPGA